MAEPKTVTEQVRALEQALRSGKTSAPVTPNDYGELDEMRELFCGGAGTVYGWLRDDELAGAVRAFPVTAGTRLPYDFKVISASTTATGLVAIR